MLWNIHETDKAILFFLNHLGAEGALRHVVIRVAATGVMYVLALIALYLLVRKPGGGQVFFFALGGGLLAVLVGKVINQIVVSDRPFVAFPDDVRHIALIVRPASFPSIHAVAAFGLSGAVLLGGYRAWGALMLALSVLMAAARVAAGVHWPSDLAGGCLVGLAAAAIWVKVQRRYWPRLGLGREAEPGKANPREC